MYRIIATGDVKVCLDGEVFDIADVRANSDYSEVKVELNPRNGEAEEKLAERISEDHGLVVRFGQRTINVDE